MANKDKYSNHRIKARKSIHREIIKNVPIVTWLNEGEEFKSIDFSNGNYYITSHGRVWSNGVRANGAVCVPRFIKAQENNKSNLCVTLMHNRETKRFSIPRLVYEAFVGKLSDNDSVICIDSNRYNLSVDNLKKVVRGVVNDNAKKNISIASKKANMKRKRNEKGQYI